MIELEKWERASNYLGTNFSEYYLVCGQHRDSDYVEQSNFIVATQRLGGESEPDVIIARSSHRAVGWVENLMVHEKAEEKLMVATDIVNDIEKCGVLDDDHWYEMKSDEVHKLIDEIKSDIAEGNVRFWSSYGINGNEGDDELWEIAESHVS
jgi:hypothetical protein